MRLGGSSGGVATLRKCCFPASILRFSRINTQPRCLAIRYPRTVSTVGVLEPATKLQQQHDPLRILFCGSDAFSVASLKALNRICQERPQVIESIDVLCKEDQRTGRGLENINEVPIKNAAISLALPYHQLRSFKNWNTSELPAINLIVAVSFGLFIPASLIEACKYGGLNVHPSVLPDLAGAAPLEHALLQGRQEVGITLQTLDKTRFDHGVILRQITNIEIPDPENINITQLREFSALLGASILEMGISSGDFLKGSSQAIANSLANLPEQGTEAAKAPKITPETRHIDWSAWSADKILRYNRVIGPLWNQAVSHKRRKSSKEMDSVFEPSEARLQLIGIQKSKRQELQPSKVGLPFCFQNDDSNKLYIRTCDGHLLEVSQLKVEGDVTKPAVKAAKKAKLIQLDRAETQEQESVAFFHGELR